MVAKPSCITSSEISDILIERPVSFHLGRKRFSLYQPSLGKIQLYSRLWASLGLKGRTAEDITLEMAKKAAESRSVYLRIIAYASLPGSECLNEDAVERRMKDLSRIDSPDLASLVLQVFFSDKQSEITKHYGIDKELEDLSRVMRVKSNDATSLSFAGKSIWGTLIDTACERYGWSYQYVLWGISYTNLQLLLADQIKTVFLTEDERKKVRGITSRKETAVRAEDKDALRKVIESENWR